MTRRAQLEREPHTTTTHAGLWLDRFLGIDRDDEQEKSKAKQELVGEVSRLGEPPEYREFYQRWRDALTALPGATATSVVESREGEVQGRLAIGLGAESVLESAITLHRTYGVPVIPGSALKGLAARFARSRLGDEWTQEGTAYQTLFGTTAGAGYITFFDALYVPGSGHAGKALWPDVITVHHPAYYQGQEDAPPADWDSPNPVPFLTATGRYLITLAGPGKWVTATWTILEAALREEGIGAKTSSGYGRMILALLDQGG